EKPRGGFGGEGLRVQLAAPQHLPVLAGNGEHEVVADEDEIAHPVAVQVWRRLDQFTLGAMLPELPLDRNQRHEVVTELVPGAGSERSQGGVLRGQPQRPDVSRDEWVLIPFTEPLDSHGVDGVDANLAGNTFPCHYARSVESAGVYGGHSGEFSGLPYVLRHGRRFPQLPVVAADGERALPSLLDEEFVVLAQPPRLGHAQPIPAPRQLDRRFG